MAKLPAAFDASKHESMDFEPLPDGMYIARLTESSMENCKPTAADPNGKYLKLTFTIDKGQDGGGRKVWHNLNLVNKNDTAVQIAQGELSALTQACGKKVIQDSQELHGIAVKLHIVQEADNRGADYPPRNRIKKFIAVDGEASKEKPKNEGGGAKKAPWDD